MQVIQIRLDGGFNDAVRFLDWLQQQDVDNAIAIAGGGQIALRFTQGEVEAAPKEEPFD